MPNWGKPFAERFWGRMDKTGDCWNWTGGCYGTGYGAITVNRRQYATHRLAWTLTNGAIPEDKEICHKCDNRKCCNPEHMFLGTHQENVIDCWKKGRHPRLRTKWKLTEDQVREIRKLYPTISMSQLARNYGLCVEGVSKIIHRETWKDVV